MTTSPSAPLGCLNILLVEDDEVDALVVKRTFRKLPQGMSVNIHRAVDGVEGLERLRELHEQHVSPLLVLLDINLPRLNGHEFLEAIRADPKLASTMVFVLTTSMDPIDIDAAYGANVVGYLPKQSSVVPSSHVSDLLLGYTKSILAPHLHALPRELADGTPALPPGSHRSSTSLPASS